MKADSNKNQEVLSVAREATQMAAIAAHHLMGSGDKNQADQVAVDAMRKVLNKLPMKGRVVIGEGEMDEAPMLYIGEEIGGENSQISAELRSIVAFDIAVDPLEGTNLCANNLPNAITAIAVGPVNSILHAPDCYMEKLAFSCNVDSGDERLKELGLGRPFSENIQLVAGLKGADVSNLKLVTLDRVRHKEFIDEAKGFGMEVAALSDGDIYGVISATRDSNSLYYGIGGAPEGVLAASALSVLDNSFMLGKLLFEDDSQRKRAREMGIEDLDAQYGIVDMVQSDVIFSASGVTGGDMLEGVQYAGGGKYAVDTMVLCSHRGLLRSKDNVSTN